MLLDRRSLLQSAAALFMPSTAGISPMGKKGSPQVNRAVERYFQTFALFYGRSYSPDDNSLEAHQAPTMSSKRAGRLSRVLGTH